MTAATFPAVRFDGRRAEAVAVAVRVADAQLIVATAEGEVLDREPIASVAVSDALEQAPRLVALPNGATLEVPDPDRGFARALDAAGLRSPLAVRLQARWPAALAAVAVLVGLLVAGYFKGLPAVARRIAFALPPRLEARMGEQLLPVLDKHYFRPTGLDGARRSRIAERFTRVAAAIAPDVQFRLEFRRGRPQFDFDERGEPRETGKTEVNAMALPGGIMILLDGLVELTGNDDEVLAVLGHEFGHVVHKHSTRQILQSLGVGAVASLLWGDFSGVAASVPVALGVLRYSRDFEREADDFAVEFLRAEGLSTRPLIEFLIKTQAHASREGGGGEPSFLLTHPAIEERLQRLQREAEPAR